MSTILKGQNWIICAHEKWIFEQNVIEMIVFFPYSRKGNAFLYIKGRVEIDVFYHGTILEYFAQKGG